MRDRPLDQVAERMTEPSLEQPTDSRREKHGDRRLGHSERRSRLLEDFGFLVGITNATLYTFGIKFGPAEPPAWAVVGLTLTLIAPKMLGRATTGRVWDKILGRIPPPSGG